MEYVSVKVSCVMENMTVKREKRKKAVIKMILTWIIVPLPTCVILKMVAVITFVLKMGQFKLVLAKKVTNWLVPLPVEILMNVNLRAYVLTSAKTKMEVIPATVIEDMKQAQSIAVLVGL
jgi:hypothetical protein